MSDENQQPRTKKTKRYEGDRTATEDLSEKIQRYNSFAEAHLKADAESAQVKNSCASCWFPKEFCCCNGVDANRFDLQHAHVVVYMHYLELNRRSNTTIGFIRGSRSNSSSSSSDNGNENDNGAGCVMLTSGNASDEQQLCELIRDNAGDVALLFPGENAISVTEFCSTSSSSTPTVVNNNDLLSSSNTTAPSFIGKRPSSTSTSTTQRKKIFVVPDGTWSQAEQLVKRVTLLCIDFEARNKVVLQRPRLVVLTVPQTTTTTTISSSSSSNNIDNTSEINNNNNNKNYIAPTEQQASLLKTPAYNNGYSFSRMRQQARQGKITTGEALWLLLKELNESALTLQRCLDIIRIRIAFLCGMSKAYNEYSSDEKQLLTSLFEKWRKSTSSTNSNLN